MRHAKLGRARAVLGHRCADEMIGSDGTRLKQDDASVPVHPLLVDCVNHRKSTEYVQVLVLAPNHQLKFMSAGVALEDTDFTVIVTRFGSGQMQFCSALTVRQFHRIWRQQILN